MKLSASSIVGSASDSTWSQAQTINLPNSYQLMVVLQLARASEGELVDLATIGGQILLTFEQFSGETEGDNKIKTMVDTVVAEIASGVDIQIVVAYLHEAELSLYGYGDVVGYLLRSGNLANLKADWGKGSLVSGTLLTGDVLFLATRVLSTEIGTSTIKTLLQTETPSESLAPLVHTHAETSGMAALVAQTSTLPEDRPLPWWKKLGRGEAKITLHQPQPWRINFWVGALIFLLLVVMIGLGIVKRADMIAGKAYATLDASVSQKIQQTLSVSDLNPEQARTLLSEARGEVVAYLATNPKPAYKAKAQQLSSTINDTEGKAFKQNNVQLSTIVELPILADGLQATKMKSDGKGDLLFLDTNSPRIVQMNLADRSRSIVATDSVGTFTDIGVEATSIYGLNDQGVQSVSMKQQTLKSVITADEFWQKPTYIGVFAGNVYVMDRAQNEVWKYPTLGDTFGGRRRWFAAGITLDLSNVVDMKVNGDIWFLTSSGKLVRYSRGAPVAFSMNGFPATGEGKLLADPVAVFPTDSLIYVLERGASRVVVFGDDGTYKAQYDSPDFGKASDLVVQDSKGYILENNTVKSFDL